MSRPWMPLYCETFLSHTNHLSAAETGAYMALVMHYWVNRSLPTSDRSLARIARMTEEEWLEHKESIAFFFNDDWTHDRVEEELQKSDEAYERRAKAGSVGGKAPKTKKTKPKPEQSGSNASSNAEAMRNLTLVQSSSNEEDAWVSVRARVTAAFAKANSPNTPDTSRVSLWRSRGHDPEICIAIVSEMVANKPDIAGLKYFDQAIADAHIAPKPQARDGPRRRPSHDGRHDVLAELRAAKDGKRDHQDEAGRPAGGPNRSAVSRLERVP